MPSRLARRLLLAAPAWVLAAGAPADAATPFSAGSGSTPAVAVDRGGTGHVAWITAGGNAQVGYCRVSAQAAGCNRAQTLAFGTATAALPASRPLVAVLAPGKVVIAATCSSCPGGGQAPTYVWTSTDGGGTFGAPRVLTVFSGNATPLDGAWLDERGIFVGIGAVIGASDAATPATAGVDYAGGTSFMFDPAVALVPGTTKLVAAVTDLDTVRYAVNTGNGTLAAINGAASWLTRRTLPSPESGSESTALAEGPNGVFLTYQAKVRGVTRVGLRRFDATANTFDAPAYVDGDDPIDRQALHDPASFQDAAGRIHLVWGVGSGGGRLRYRVSDAGTTAFAPAANLAAGEPVDDPDVGAGADGKGFAVWSGSANAVRAVAIGPQARPPQAGVRTRATLVSGTVRVRLPRRSGFVPLTNVASLPVGSVVDARRGVLALETALNGFPASSPRMRRQTIRLRAGIFAILQRRAHRRGSRISTDLALVSPPRAEARCKGRAPRKGVVRELDVQAKGLVRAIAGAGTATARKGRFVVTDRCDGTLVRVLKGRVAVRVKGHNVTIRAGHSRLLRARIFVAKRHRGSSS